MSCTATRKQFSAYVEAELSEAERQRVASHLESCPVCSRELEKFRKTVTLIRWIPPVEAGVDFTARVMARVRAEDADPGRRARFRDWLTGLRLAWPWQGIELPIPALASAGAAGMVAGVMLTLRLVSVDGLVAQAPQVPGELAGLAQSRTATSAPASVSRAPAATVPARSAYGDYMARARGGGYPIPVDQSYRPLGWNEAFRGERLEGPAPVAIVEYVLQRIQYHPVQVPSPPRTSSQLPVGLRVEDGYVTF